MPSPGSSPRAPIGCTSSTSPPTSEPAPSTSGRASPWSGSSPVPRATPRWTGCGASAVWTHRAGQRLEPDLGLSRAGPWKTRRAGARRSGPAGRRGTGQARPGVPGVLRRARGAAGPRDPRGASAGACRERPSAASQRGHRRARRRRIPARDPAADLRAGEHAGARRVPRHPRWGLLPRVDGGRDTRNSALAESLGMAVVSVDYRLAPENPWPAAPDDCEAAALWLIDQAELRFGTTALAIGGSSSGATLAMTTLLRLRDSGRADSLAGAALQFGTYDLSGQTPAGRLIADEYFLEAYVGHLADRTVPDVSPVFGDLRDLPPTLLIVGASDVLLEDNLVMAALLSAAGGEVDLRIYPESPHGFTGHPTSMARAALSDRDAWLAELFTPSATSRHA